MKRIKLSQYAKDNGISYMTAYRMYQRREIHGIQLQSGTILIEAEPEPAIAGRGVAIYCRVSSTQNKANLETQKERLYNYCIAKGYAVDRIVCEVGLGVNDKRKKWIELLKDKTIGKIVVEHKDRFTRFGFNAIECLLRAEGRVIEVVNKAEDTENDIMQDFIAIITSFCARIYGNRRTKRITEKLIQELESDKE